MISQVSYPNVLNIKPVKTYPENSGRETTITAFKEILDDKKDKIKKEENSNRKEAPAEDKDNSSKAADGITYRDPVTGNTVMYIDVAEDNDKPGKKVESSGGAQAAVPASSMKKTKYDEYFKAAAKKYNVSESLLKAIAKAESDFNPDCVSSAGAMGVMQLMPETAKGLGVDDPYDPEQNIMGGAKCIAMKLKEFNGDVRLALAAYNAGSGAVRRNGGVPSYCTTYVNRVLSYKEAFETANSVG